MQRIYVNRLYIYIYIYVCVCVCVYQSHSTVDLIVLKMYVCDYCRREYSVKKSLTRHVKEKHIKNKFYPCAIHTCKAKFIAHLGKIH